MPVPFRRVAILGTGLIGGSFALALRKYAPDTIVIGWDKAHILRHALERGAIHEGVGELSLAVAGADLIYTALPVGQTIELLPEIARLAATDALVTDASSTKRSVCTVAAGSFREGGAQFLGGHPMAGKEIPESLRPKRNYFAARSTR
jgi:prephenate dehydrogenase